MKLKNIKTLLFIWGGLGLLALGTIASSLFFWHKPQENGATIADFSYCSREIFEEKSYIVCRAHPARDDIKLFLYNKDGKPYKRFSALNAVLNKESRRLAFAMNGGMYHANHHPVGLYIEDGGKQQEISLKEGPGNFHMLPNGVFYLDQTQAGVLDTHTYLEHDIKPLFATQSGPMLVINGAIHPRFIPNSPFLEYRNGVGVTNEGEVIFVISETKVNFDEMARLFRDHLATPNALFLDGSISSLYAPELGRADWFYPMGPIIGVVVKQSPAGENSQK